MKAIPTVCLLASLFGGAVVMMAQAGADTKNSAQPKARAKAHTSSDPGEQAFRHNCSRCHSAPEQLSPHITGTILQHMRVRANLSAADEKLLLNYLAP